MVVKQLNLSRIKYRIFVLLSFLVLAAHFSNLSTQWESPPDARLSDGQGRAGTPSEEDVKTIVTGKISDVETGELLVNVIVFLSQTPLGSSSGKDGKFRIANIPNGDYEIVISRVGYERQIITLQISKPESLYYEIKLRPQPVQTKEVEIISEAPEDAKQFFFPKENPGMFCIYGKVSTIPIGVFFADSALYMYSLEPVILDSVKYIRLWLLYKNLSQTQYDFNPRKLLKLHMKGKTYSIKEIPPDLHSFILPLIDTQQIISRIAETVGSSLEALATRQSVFKWEMEHTNLLFIMSPRPAIIRPSNMSPAREGSLSARLYSIFTNSVNVGIMKRYIVYPGNSVNGYVYFPFPGLNWKATGSSFPEASDYIYTIEIMTPNGSKTIEFIPN
ncbi:MAG: carboxypeptidase-like regulatory domain-containing protein [Ignavibacteriales bacterium]|nr:carboxypeptidase-like regulatory domain-containing protein [Ignavibacteriales bacterium]